MIKEQGNEKIKYLEAKLLEQQKECIERTIESKKSGYSEAELMFQKQKEILRKEMKDERDRIIKEIVDKVINEHLTIITQLKREISAKEEINSKLDNKIKDLTNENSKLRMELNKTKVSKVDYSTSTDQIINDEAKEQLQESIKNYCENNEIIDENNSRVLNKVILENEEVNIIKFNDSNNKVKTNLDVKINNDEYKTISIEMRKNIPKVIQTFELINIFKNVSDNESKYKVMYAKMQTLVNLSKATIDILRGKLKSVSIKYQNLCQVISDSNT